MRDTVQRGIYAGALGTLGDVFIHWPAMYALGTSTTAHYMTQLIFPFDEVTNSRLAIGFAGHFFAGVLAGVLLALALQNWGYDRACLKGAVFALALWLMQEIVIPNLIAPRPFLQRTEAEVLVDLAAELVYGTLAAGYLMRTASAGG